MTHPIQIGKIHFCNKKKLAGMNIVNIHRHFIDIHNSTKLDQHIHHQLRY